MQATSASSFAPKRDLHSRRSATGRAGLIALRITRILSAGTSRSFFRKFAPAMEFAAKPETRDVAIFSIARPRRPVPEQRWFQMHARAPVQRQIKPHTTFGNMRYERITSGRALLSFHVRIAKLRIWRNFGTNH